MDERFEINGISLPAEVLHLIVRSLRTQKFKHLRQAQQARTEGTADDQRRKARNVDEALAVLAYATGIEIPMTANERKMARRMRRWE